MMRRFGIWGFSLWVLTFVRSEARQIQKRDLISPDFSSAISSAVSSKINTMGSNLAPLFSFSPSLPTLNFAAPLNNANNANNNGSDTSARETRQLATDNATLVEASKSLNESENILGKSNSEAGVLGASSTAPPVTQLNTTNSNSSVTKFDDAALGLEEKNESRASSLSSSNEEMMSARSTSLLQNSTTGNSSADHLTTPQLLNLSTDATVEPVVSLLDPAQRNASQTQDRLPLDEFAVLPFEMDLKSVLDSSDISPLDISASANGSVLSSTTDLSVVQDLIENATATLLDNTSTLISGSSIQTTIPPSSEALVIVTDTSSKPNDSERIITEQPLENVTNATLASLETSTVSSVGNGSMEAEEIDLSPIINADRRSGNPENETIDSLNSTSLRLSSLELVPAEEVEETTEEIVLGVMANSSAAPATLNATSANIIENTTTGFVKVTENMVSGEIGVAENETKIEMKGSSELNTTTASTNSGDQSEAAAETSNRGANVSSEVDSSADVLPVEDESDLIFQNNNETTQSADSENSTTEATTGFPVWTLPGGMKLTTKDFSKQTFSNDSTFWEEFFRNASRSTSTTRYRIFGLQSVTQPSVNISQPLVGLSSDLDESVELAPFENVEEVFPGVVNVPSLANVNLSLNATEATDSSSDLVSSEGINTTNKGSSKSSFSNDPTFWEEFFKNASRSTSTTKYVIFNLKAVTEPSVSNQVSNVSALTEEEELILAGGKVSSQSSLASELVTVSPTVQPETTESGSADANSATQNAVPDQRPTPQPNGDQNGSSIDNETVNAESPTEAILVLSTAAPTDSIPTIQSQDTNGPTTPLSTTVMAGVSTTPVVSVANSASAPPASSRATPIETVKKSAALTELPSEVVTQKVALTTQTPTNDTQDGYRWTFPFNGLAAPADEITAKAQNLPAIQAQSGSLSDTSSVVITERRSIPPAGSSGGTLPVVAPVLKVRPQRNTKTRPPRSTLTTATQSSRPIDVTASAAPQTSTESTTSFISSTTTESASQSSSSSVLMTGATEPEVVTPSSLTSTTLSTVGTTLSKMVSSDSESPSTLSAASESSSETTSASTTIDVSTAATEVVTLSAATTSISTSPSTSSTLSSVANSTAGSVEQSSTVSIPVLLNAPTRTNAVTVTPTSTQSSASERMPNTTELLTTSSQQSTSVAPSVEIVTLSEAASELATSTLLTSSTSQDTQTVTSAAFSVPLVAAAIAGDPSNNAADEAKFWSLVMSSKKSASQVRGLANTAVAGVSYPNFKSRPQTSFSCDDVNQPGYYADVESGCQGYHRCDNNGGKYSFFCSEGTLFSQLLLVCDHWYNVNCQDQVRHADYVNSRVNSFKKFDAYDPENRQRLKALRAQQLRHRIPHATLLGEPPAEKLMVIAKTTDRPTTTRSISDSVTSLNVTEASLTSTATSIPFNVTTSSLNGTTFDVLESIEEP